MKKQILTLVLFFAAILVSFSQTSWEPKTALVSFKIKNGGITVEGNFTGLVAKINFDANNFSKGSIEASVKVSTIKTGIDLRDSHLKKSEYFNETKYPKITLNSTSFSKKKDGTFIGIFNLKIKDVTKEVSIPFTYKEDGNECSFKGTFSINRLDYKVGESSWTMSNSVNISISLHANK